MADEHIRAGEAETVREETSELREEAADIRQEVRSGQLSPDAAEERLRQIESRIAENERNLVELRQHADGKADNKHDHPAHPELRAISEHLDSILKTEKKPKRRSWFWGGS